MYKTSKMALASKTVWASKTAFASKMVCASKMALATILLGFLFVGGASLRAQEGSENGWFVSASPLIFGASKIETKTTITASGGGEVTVGDLTADVDNAPATLVDRYKTVARDSCAGTLEQIDLDYLEIFYLAEDRSDATDVTLASGYDYIIFEVLYIVIFKF